MSVRRVVITGLGVVAPNGIGKDEFWKANIEGKSGVEEITTFDVCELESKIYARVKDFQHLNYIPKEEARKVDRFVHLGLASTKLGLDDSGLNLENIDRDRFGVIIGSGLGGSLFHEEQILTGYEKGLHRLNPRSVPRISPNAVASHIAIQYGLKGPNMVISNACASGAYAIGEAFRQIQNDDMDYCVCGGAEAPLSEFTFGAYCALKVLSKRNDSPQEASRPFDRERDGFVLAEGSAVLILEELTFALKRNAHIYAEIIGFGATSGAYHIVMPEPSGLDAAKTISRAIETSGIKPGEINYINAHGTSTVLNDKAETRGIKEVFGSYAYKLPISSTKSMIGHSIGAAGAIEALVCALTIENNLIPPTINYKSPDPDCDLDYVPNQSRRVKVRVALSNSFGFGNCNACLILKRFAD
jgi:3-oxoacyl-[acyl-carrier-protein] synthase II